MPLHPSIPRKLGFLALSLLTLAVAMPVGYATAGNDIDSLQRLLLAERDDSTRVELQIKLARNQHRADHHADACLAAATAAVEQAAAMDNTILYAKSLDNLGLLYRYHQYYSEALPLHQRAFDLIEHTHATALNKMIVANNVGVAARHNGSFDIAVTYYLKSLTIAEREDDKKNMEIASNGLGNALMNLPGREEEALDYLLGALEIAKASDNKLGQAMNYLSIGGYYDERGEHGKAREYFHDLRRLNEEIGDENGMAITYQAIGNSFLMENQNLSAAQSYFEIARKRFAEIGNETGLAHTLNRLGTIRYRNKEAARGLPYFFQAMEVGERLGNKSLIQHNAEMISRSYEDLKNPIKALQYYKIAHQYRDSIALTEQRTAMAAIKSRYDFERKEQEIELLTKDKLLQNAQLKSSTLIIYLMSGLLLFLLGLIFLQFRIRRIRRRAAALIEEQKHDKLKAQYEKSVMEAEMIATRMQVNPHFMFNSLTAIKYMIQSNENSKALKYLVTFSRFIRSVLETSEQPVHTVAAELQLLEYFLKLEANRFDGDFNYRIHNEVDEWAERKVIPALLLQPFVENAIWHGLLPCDQHDKMLTISARSDTSGITIELADNGVGFTAAKEPADDGHKSMGHKITDKRIDLYNKSFPDQIAWTIGPLTDGGGATMGTRVQLTIRIGSHGENLQETYRSIQSLITETT